MVLISMVVAVATTGWQARVARAERGRAEREAAEARFQSQRAEHQSQEAELYRARAEREAEFAREQLRIVEQRTQEAEARRREAAIERERAERRARDVQSIAASLLDVNANVPEIPGAIEAGKRAAADAERILLTLSSEGFADPSLAKDVVALQGVDQKVRSPRGECHSHQSRRVAVLQRASKDYEFGIDRSNSVTGASALHQEQTRASPRVGSVVPGDRR